MSCPGSCLPAIKLLLTVWFLAPVHPGRSLERMTAGFDPDRRVVLRDGSVLQEGTGEGATKKDK